MRKKIDDYHFFIEGKIFSRKQRSLSEGVLTCKKEKEQLDSLLKNSALDKDVATSQPFLTKELSTPKKLIADEYTVRGKLLIAVLSRGMKAVLKAKMIYYTWGMDAIKSNVSVHFFVPGEENVTELTYFPHTALSEAASISKVAAVFETLGTIYSRYGTDYDWIYLVHDDVYVRVDMLLDLLSSLDPKGLVYLGHPSKGHSSENNQFSLLPHEAFCSGGPGFVLSFATLKLLVPYLPTCLQAVETHNKQHPDQEWVAEDMELGRCISRTIGIQCSRSKEAYQGFLTDWTGKAADAPKTLWKDGRYQRAITVYPIHTFQAIRTFHYLYSWLRVKALHTKGQRVLYMPLVDACTLMPEHLVPKGMANTLQYCKSQAKSCMPLEYHFYKRPYPDMDLYKPENRHDQPEWMYFDEEKIYINNNDHPVVGQSGEFSEKLRNLIHDIKMFLQKKNKMPVGGVKIRGGYFRENSHRGREIIVDIEMNNYTMVEGRLQSVLTRPRVELIQPVPQQLYVEMESVTITDKLTVIVPIVSGHDIDSRVDAFLSQYAASILERHGNAELILVTYGNGALTAANKYVEVYMKKYRDSVIKIIPLKEEYSYLKAVRAAIADTGTRDLMYISDIDTALRSDFIMRCRKTTHLGQRIYIPIPFQLYNDSYTYKMHQRPKVPFVSREAGYWDHSNYHHICIYKSDFILAEKSGHYVQDHISPDSPALLIAGAMKQGIQTIRAPDPGLMRNHQPKLCPTTMGATARESCLAWPSRNLADRRDLAINMLMLENKLGLDPEEVTTQVLSQPSIKTVEFTAVNADN